jgi:hypothetical protein
MCHEVSHRRTNSNPRKRTAVKDRRALCETHRKPLMMHEFHDHLIWDSRRARGAAVLCSSSALGQFTRRGGLSVVTARIDRFIAKGGKGPYPDME